MPAPALSTDRPDRCPPAQAPPAWAATLDRLVPLQNASHRDADAFDVDVPLRYAECFAELADGRRVRPRDRTQLLGWSGQRDRREYWFRAGGGLLRLRTANRRVVELVVYAAYDCCAARSAADAAVRALPGSVHRVTGIDGGLLFVAPHLRARAGAGQQADSRTGRRAAAPALIPH